MPRFPESPSDVSIYNPGILYAVDLTFSDPKQEGNNSVFNIQGVNVYRSYDDINGPYTLLNAQPLQVGYYRDEHKISQITEDVTNKFKYKGDNPRKEWIIQLDNKPVINNIVYTQFSEGQDILVNIDGQDIRPLKADGARGLVWLNTYPVYDPISHISTQPILPHSGSSVTCKYFYVSNFVQNNLNRRIYYKITTRGFDPDASEYFETPLAVAKTLALEEMSFADPIWQEAMRRNYFILEQGGERVKLYLRKWAGTPCPNNSPTHKSTLNDCVICFGTGYIGGYNGPYDLIIAPPDEAKALEATPEGLKPSFTFETFTGPSPLISQRDFIVRKNGDRFSIGAVNLTTVSGAPLQQRFSVALLSSRDIRYSVPLNPELVTPPNNSPTEAPSPESIKLRKKVWEDLF